MAEEQQRQRGKGGAQAGEAKRQRWFPLPGLAGSGMPPGAGSQQDLQQATALCPCQHKVPFTGHKNATQEPPKQHDSKNLAAKTPSTNPLKSVCAAEVSPSPASCSGQQSSFPPEGAHHNETHTDTRANIALLAALPSCPFRA